MAHVLTPWATAVAMLLAMPAAAQVVAPPAPIALSFDAASRTLDRQSHGLNAADHGVRAAQATADSFKTLRRPVVSASASFVEYQKTLSLDLSGAKNEVSTATGDFLAGLRGNFRRAFRRSSAR